MFHSVVISPCRKMIRNFWRLFTLSLPGIIFLAFILAWNSTKWNEMTGLRCLGKLRKLYFYFYRQFGLLPEVTEYSFFTVFPQFSSWQLLFSEFSFIQKTCNETFHLWLWFWYFHVLCDFVTVSDPTLLFCFESNLLTWNC